MQKNKLIPALESGLILIASRSIEGVVDRDAGRRSGAGIPHIGCQVERREAQGSHAEGPRAPGPPPPQRYAWVPEAWRESGPPSVVRSRAPYAGALAPPGAPSPRERGEETGIRAHPAARKTRRREAERWLMNCENLKSNRETRALLFLIAPVELADFRRAALEIPVAAEQAEPRLVGARHDDVRRNPVLAVADDDVALVLAAHRRDRAVDDLLDLDDAGLAIASRRRSAPAARRGSCRPGFSAAPSSRRRGRS